MAVHLTINYGEGVQEVLYIHHSGGLMMVCCEMAMKRSEIVAASVRKMMVLIMKLDTTNN
jgi:hypothetical protein